MPSSQELVARLWRRWDETPRASEPGAMPPSQETPSRQFALEVKDHAFKLRGVRFARQVHHFQRHEPVPLVAHKLRYQQLGSVGIRMFSPFNTPPNPSGSPRKSSGSKRSKPIDNLGIGSAKTSRQSGDDVFITSTAEVLHPEEELEVSIAKAVFSDVTNCKDTSEVPKDFFEKLARMLFRMCHRDPAHNAGSFTATATQLQAANVLVGDNWSEYPGYKHIGILMETVVNQQELYPEYVFGISAPFALSAFTVLKLRDVGYDSSSKTVKRIKSCQIFEYLGKAIDVYRDGQADAPIKASIASDAQLTSSSQDTTLSKEHFLKDNQKWLDNLGNPDVDRMALKRSVDRAVTKETARLIPTQYKNPLRIFLRGLGYKTRDEMVENTAPADGIVVSEPTALIWQEQEMSRRLTGGEKADQMITELKKLVDRLPGDLDDSDLNALQRQVLAKQEVESDSFRSHVTKRIQENGEDAKAMSDSLSCRHIAISRVIKSTTLFTQLPLRVELGVDSITYKRFLASKDSQERDSAYKAKRTEGDV
ncbi:hypothetical protein ACHAPJ_005899 [Fusarium lateritium]